MHLKALIALTAACLVGQTVAADRHQHGHRNLHTKRDVFTEVVTVTNWVTVTVTGGGSSTRARTHYTNSRKYRTRSSSESTTTSSVPAPPPSTPLAVPTTIVTQVKPATPSDDPSVAPPADTAPPVVQPPPPPVDTQPPPPPPPPASSSTPAQDPARDGNGGNGGTGGVKRGLAYNKRELLSRFLNAGSKVSWLYNWGQYDDSNTDLEFCPMLWGLKLDFAQTWPGNAQKAIDAGSRCLFSFNEPDLDSQANMSPQLAAEKHIELMNPFSGQARIGTPAITNSVSPNQGIDWMRQWFNACGGRCAADFVNIHIYGVDTKTFLAHVLNVYNTFRMPVWITEFAFNGAEDEINSQLATVIEQIEHNSTFAFVERYSYFMVEEGFMVKGNSMSSYGNTFAYGA
ncbi:hypothetical protein VTK26DRAFT_3079 [Humicola hyalothermophila]